MTRYSMIACVCVCERKREREREREKVCVCVLCQLATPLTMSTDYRAHF